MKPLFPLIALGALHALVSAGPAMAQAQAPTGWVAQVDGLAVAQGSADLSDGGAFSASRSFLRAASIYRFQNGNSAGVSASFGQFDYDFKDAANQPWTDIRDIRLSVPLRFGLTDTASVFLSPQIRWDYQRGASASDGRTYGLFAGLAWQVSDSLTIGPAFGAFSQLEEGGLDLFPALLVNWDITEQWNLTTGSGIGATGGPGLTLGYALNNTMTVALSARSERVRFRLDGTGLAPDGVGEDRSIPVVVSFDYAPNPGVSFSVFAGAEFDGQLTLDDATGTEISRQSYDTAPLAGVTFRVRF